MDKGLAVLLTAVAGGLIALQAPINAGLGRATGSLPAALVSFLVGTVALAAIVVLSGKAGGLGSKRFVDWSFGHYLRIAPPPPLSANDENGAHHQQDDAEHPLRAERDFVKAE